MANPRKKKCAQKMRAFNTNYLVYLIGFCFALCGDIYLLVEEKRLSWILSIIVIVCLFLLCADSVYYIFTKKELICVHFWGYKWVLPWSSVTSVLKHGFWDSHKDLPRYEIHYTRLHKGKMIIKSIDIPSTPLTKKCMNTYYVGGILGEDKKKKKQH